MSNVMDKKASTSAVDLLISLLDLERQLKDTQTAITNVSQYPEALAFISEVLGSAEKQKG